MQLERAWVCCHASSLQFNVMWLYWLRAESHSTTFCFSLLTQHEGWTRFFMLCHNSDLLWYYMLSDTDWFLLFIQLIFFSTHLSYSLVSVRLQSALLSVPGSFQLKLELGRIIWHVHSVYASRCVCFTLCMLRVVYASREDLVLVAGQFQPKLELRRVW